MLEIVRPGVPLILGIVGLLFGSLGNVIIWRVPRGESIAAPGSHCPRCDTPLKWYDNVPVVSWLLLRARCRYCGEPISPRYPLVEIASGALWAVAGWRWGLTVASLAGALFFYLLLLLSLIDIDTQRLPTAIVAAVAVIGSVAAVLGEVTGGEAGPLVGVAQAGWFAHPVVAALAGAILGGGMGLAVAGVYRRLRGRAGLGAGDVRLLGAMGLFLGPYVVMAYVLGNLLALIGIITAKREPDEPLAAARIPFGPFLAVAAFVVALGGPAIFGAYLRLVGVG